MTSAQSAEIISFFVIQAAGNAGQIMMQFKFIAIKTNKSPQDQLILRRFSLLLSDLNLFFVFTDAYLLAARSNAAR